jgi:SAM-dependent methyltransferase
MVPTENPLSDVVACQYERWSYPPAIDDLEAWLKERHEIFDPSINHRLFWPDRDYRGDLDILIAGCGTNQAAVFAYKNREARVLGIDVSEASLAHEAHLKKKYGLSNLELVRLPIEAVASLGRDFDLVVSTGVLHHMNDPAQGMKALASCLRRDGVAGIMLYARYGRVGVEALQSVFRSLGLRQDEQSLALVKETLGLLPREHLVQPYFPIAADLQFDAGLVDTFLHGRDRSYSVPDCLALVATAGLVFQGWVTHDCYYPEMFAPLSSAVYAALNRLPEPELWAAMERLQTQNGCHTFMACRAERSQRQYTIDFSGREYLDYIPEFRHLVRVDNDHVVSLRGRIPLNRAQALLLHEVNGSRRISELVSRTVAAGMFTNRGEAEEFARDLFRSLWRLALMAFNLKQVAGSQSSTARIG